jgi:hypothetical protein
MQTTISDVQATEPFQPDRNINKNMTDGIQLIWIEENANFLQKKPIQH